MIPLREIAELVGGKVLGDDNVNITGVSGIKEAKEGTISFVANAKYLSLLEGSKASAIIVNSDVKVAFRPLVLVDDPYLAFTKVMALWANDETPSLPNGIHPTAILGRNVTIGDEVSIQPYVVIDHDAKIGDRVTIYPHVHIGSKSCIGDDTLIYSRVSIRERTSIGKRCIIHSGVVIGSDGFGFTPVKGVHHKVPQTGTVIVEDDVEIGANATIDRATINKTLIGKGTKIDNLVQIGHNVVTGENCIIVSQTGISGSSVLGKGVTVAGQVGIAEHLTIGDRSVIAARAVVTKSLPPDSFVSGFPAKPHEKEKRIKAGLHRLPALHKTVAEQGKKLKRLEEKLLEDKSG